MTLTNAKEILAKRLKFGDPKQILATNVIDAFERDALVQCPTCDGRGHTDSKVCGECGQRVEKKCSECEGSGEVADVSAVGLL